MVQDNSLLDQARYSEQMSLQQMQLAELQKITNQLSSVASSAAASNSVGTQATAGVGAMPTNMMAAPNPVQGAFDAFGQVAAVGGMALRSGVNHMNNAVGVGRAALDRSTSYIENMQNSPFFAYRSIDWTRTNAKQADFIDLQSRHKVNNAALNVASAFGNMGMSAVGGAIGSTVAGPIGTVVGTIAGSALGSLGGDQIIKHVGVQQGYESWLHQNSGRFINMFESNGPFGEGFSRQEGQKLAKSLSKMNTKFFMSDDEMFTMLNQVTDAGLMKSASDMEDFTKRFSGLVESVKKGAKMLNTSYEEMVNLYGEWNKMGIKTDAEKADMTSKIKTLSSITGKSEGDAASILNALIGNITSGTTLDSAYASGVAQSDLSLASIAREKGLYSQDMARYVENYFGSDDTKVAAAMASGIKAGYGNEQIKSAALAAMKLDAGGNVVIDKDQLNAIVQGLQSGTTTIDQVMSAGGAKLQSGQLGANFAHQWTTMTGDQLYEMILEGAGNTGANNLLSSLLNSAAEKSPHLDRNSLMVNMGIASDTNQAKMLSEWMTLQGTYGNAVGTDVTRQNLANSIRNDASSEFGVSLTQRIKNGWESGWQTVASWMPSLGGAFDSVKDFWTDTDTAMRNGYSNKKKTNIADDEYKDVFKDILDNSDKLDSKVRNNVKDSLEKEKSSSALSKGFSSFFDIITSPSKWDTALTGGSFTNTDLSHGGLSVKKLLKKVEKSKEMSQADKDSMIANINQATGQTQDMVSGALDVVTALGGRKAREKMIDGITIDSITRAKSGANTFDDFTNEKVLNKLSLDNQKQIQTLAIDEATKQIEKQFGRNLDGLASLVRDKGYADNNERVQKILDNGISKGEIKSLVKELMTAAQGGSGESEVNQLLGDTTKDVAKSTKNANKNLDKANQNMSDMSKKLDELADTINKAVKNLDKRTNQLEQTMNRY